MILNGSVQNREVLSLILDWANRGYLTIEDQEKTLKLNKLMSLPEDAPVAELRLFSALFKNRDSVTTKQLEEVLHPSQPGDPGLFRLLPAAGKTVVHQAFFNLTGNFDLIGAAADCDSGGFAVLRC